MSGLSTKESEDNEDIWKYKCMKCIRCNEQTNCNTCWPCKLGKTCEKRRCFSARKAYEDSVRKMADMNLAAIKAKTAAREAAASSGPIVLPTTSSAPSTSRAYAVPEPKKRGRKKKSELAALAQQDRRINEMDYVPHRPTRQQSADLRKKRNTTSELQSTTVREPRQCLQPDCIYEARPESKYCSDDCGRILAKMRLTEILPQRVKEYFEPAHGGERNFEEVLNRQGEKVQQDMQRLEGSEKKMMGFLDKLNAFVEKQINLPPLAVTEKIDDNLYEGCVVCGLHDIPIRKYAKHIELCWSRSEKGMSFAAPDPSSGVFFCEKFDPRSGVYCKRLKSLCPEHRKPGIEQTLKVCGYPKRWESGIGGKTSNSFSELIEMQDPFGDEGCRTKKDICHKHHKWIPSLRGCIELEMSGLFNKMLELMQLGAKIKGRIEWSTNALSILMHKEAVITDPQLFEQHLKELRGEEADEPESSSTNESNSTQASEEMLDAAGFLADLARRKDEQQAALDAEAARRAAEEEEEREESPDYSIPGPSNAGRRA